MAEVIGVLNFFISFIGDSSRVGAVHVKDAKTLNTIATVGNLLKTLIGVATPAAGLGSKLAELSSKLKALDRRLAQEMAGLKAFIVEHNFGVNLVVRVNTMNQYMQAHIAYPTDHNCGLYQKEILDFPPLRYARDVASWLMQDSTNPIRNAMNADPLRSTETFEKWEKSILTLLNQLSIQEAYLNGLFWNKNMIGPNQLQEVIRDVERQIDKLRKEYKECYWPDMVNHLIHRTQDDHGDDSNEQKCAIIRNGLRKMMTDDEFYVMVYDHCGGWNPHSFYGYNYLHSFRRNGCNVVVCRSRRWNKETADNHRKFRDQLNRIDFKSVTRGKDDMHYIPQQIKDRVDRCNFVGIISTHKNPVVYAANRLNESEYGPGDVISVNNGYESIRSWWGIEVNKIYKNYCLIACFD